MFGGVFTAQAGADLGAQYFSGYIVEKSLSIDNLFVFVIIMTTFALPEVYQQKVLTSGIVMAPRRSGPENPTSGDDRSSIGHRDDSVTRHVAMHAATGEAPMTPREMRPLEADVRHSPASSLPILWTWPRPPQQLTRPARPTTRHQVPIAFNSPYGLVANVSDLPRCSG